MKVIELTKGQVTTVDDEDFDYLAQYRWRCSSEGYARRNSPRHPITNKQKTISMAREIMGFPKGMIVDHINGNRLDNRRCNLRIVTIAQSNINKGCPKNNQFGAKGVTFAKDTRKYQTQIGVNGRSIYLGQYPTLEKAKAVYDAACIKYHGQFARLN